jgi:galactokinase/mevalonate kinase-like predicted kinase
MSPQFEKLESRRRPDWFATHDPGGPIGSGGGTANLLAEAWQATGEGKAFREWLRCRPKLVVHSGGQSRRLPAYAAAGKALMPISAERGTAGQAFDQSLLDLQTAVMERLFEIASPDTVLAVISGDALLRPDRLPRTLPVADVVCLGIEVPAEEATDFGTFFTTWNEDFALDCCLQKPTLAQIRGLAETHRCLMDVGVWFLNEEAALALMSACGWDSGTESFPKGVRPYDLYSDFGLGLGKRPTTPRPETEGLSSAVAAIDGSFYHFGTNRQMLDSVIRLQVGSRLARNDLGFITTAKRRLNQAALNTHFEQMPEFAHEAKVWIENSFVAAGSTFAGDNLLTNSPSLGFPVHLAPGQCLDFVPVGQEKWCVRVYGFDDRFKGALGDARTYWLGGPAQDWFTSRGLTVDLSDDIQDAPIFPILSLSEITGESLSWLLNGGGPSLAHWWTNAERISAQQIQDRANMPRLYAQRRRFRNEALETTLRNCNRSIFFNIDLERGAEQIAESEMPWDAHPLLAEASPAQRLHERMFRSEVLRHRGDERAKQLEMQAFQVLQNVIVGADWLHCQPPCSTLLPDQIAWSRSPLRMDLAGGWTDTAPYGMMFGGRVVNVAVDLNGQPPVQVFARVIKEPKVVLKSIDLGTQLDITDFDGMRTEVEASSEFSLAKTALALSGFTPQFLRRPESSLTRQLEAFGGGVELTMLAAVPKGSGLGTSSILSAAILSALSEICGHYWSPQQIFDRVSASEQMLTTGGGWQDQAGGLLPAIKLLTTQPGVRQEINANWLPDHALANAIAQGSALLYYTGVTRLAKDVLKEIVRGMFLNSGPRLATLRQIGENTVGAVEALQTRSYEGLGKAVRRSWMLNQALDSGTNPPSVARIYDLIDDLVIGAKLLGAGGGGYMLLLCKDPEAASRAKQVLLAENRASGARFVDLSISQTGLEVSKS